MCSMWHSLSNRGETLSGPQALFTFKDFSTLATSLGVQIRSLMRCTGKTVE